MSLICVPLDLLHSQMAAVGEGVSCCLYKPDKVSTLTHVKPHKNRMELGVGKPARLLRVRGWLSSCHYFTVKNSEES